MKVAVYRSATEVLVFPVDENDKAIGTETRFGAQYGRMEVNYTYEIVKLPIAIFYKMYNVELNK